MTELESAILNRVVEVFDQYNALMPKRQIDLEEISVRFTLRGGTAGTANWTERELNFNLILAKTNLDAFLARTVPHEIAHLFQKSIYPKSKPHGIEWQHLMRLGGYDPVRCHTYDTSALPRKTYAYTCDCPGVVHQLSQRLHNKIMRGSTRRCVICRGVVTATFDTLISDMTYENRSKK